MIIETFLNDGTPVCIRPVRDTDEQRLKAGISQLSKRSRYLRFFSGMHVPPRTVIDKLLDVDGYNHIAWGALASSIPSEPALGVVHAFRDENDPLIAEFSVAVIDAYHGRGLARLMTAVLLLDCQDEGLKEFAVNILAENKAALALTRSLGGTVTNQDREVIEFDIEIANAIEALKVDSDVPGLQTVFEQFATKEATRFG